MEGKVKLQEVLPADIEKRSFEIISREMGDVKLDPLEEPIVKRVIHTSADFDYLENLVFSPGAVETAMEAIGNAPTALVTLYELIQEGRLCPALIIGVPVGFVNVVESKELILKTDVPYIVARGRKGGSNIAAAICNALLYQCGGRD